MANFLKVANTVKKNLNTKYHNGEFVDPAIDAYKEDWEWKLSQLWSGSTSYKGLNNMALSLNGGVPTPTDKYKTLWETSTNL